MQKNIVTKDKVADKTKIIKPATRCGVCVDVNEDKHRVLMRFLCGAYFQCTERYIQATQEHELLRYAA